MFTEGAGCVRCSGRGAIAKDRAQDRIAQLSRRGHGRVTFWRECTEVLEAAVPHYDRLCWYTLDAASHMITCRYRDGLPEFPREVFLDRNCNGLRCVQDVPQRTANAAEASAWAYYANVVDDNAAAHP